MYLWTFCSIFNLICVGVLSYSMVKDLYKGPTGSMVYYKTGSSLIFRCYNSIRLTDAFPSINITETITSVIIYKCEPTNTSYSAELQAFNVNASTIESLYLTFDADKPLPPGNYTEGLSIRILSIKNTVENEYFLKNVKNFLRPLKNLRSLILKQLVISSLPYSTHVVRLRLEESASLEKWKNCQYLQNLTISEYRKITFPDWPRHCRSLKYLYLYNLSPASAGIVIQNMVTAADSLLTLKINRCDLKILPVELLLSAKKLINLDLSQNELEDSSIPLLPNCTTLTSLNLGSNYFKEKSWFKGLVSKLPALRELHMADSLKFIINCKSNATNPFIPLRNSSLEVMNLGDARLNPNCFSGLHFENLRSFSMRPSYENTFKLLDLPTTNAGSFEVNLGSRSDLNKILFDETDYETLKQKNSSVPYKDRNLKITSDYKVSCDCKHGWLTRALREFPNTMSMPELFCIHDDNKNHILDEPKENLECNKTDYDGCIYRKSWYDGTVIAECDRDAWNRMELLPVHGLNVSGRRISTLHSNLPDTLQWIDLRDNLISSGNAAEAAALFAAERHIWLADNSLTCDCNNSELVDAIQQHQKQVEDFALLKCAGSGEALSSISTAQLCQTALITTALLLAACGILLVIAGVIALLMRRYGEQLRMFLYSRGWCISCLQKKDNDDKPYDAFLSFAHEDREYVMETLLPGLENAPEKFRICVHYRDCFVGDWIPAQIMRSVQLSKRTLIFLSRNFVASPWSTLEFRYAVANADEDPTVKVLVLIKDDVLDMNLQMELRRYLTFNTYLHCDDPWFWEKLRYAMPHRGNTHSSRRDDTDTGVRIGEMYMRNPNLAITFDNSVYVNNVEEVNTNNFENLNVNNVEDENTNNFENVNVNNVEDENTNNFENVNVNNIEDLNTNNFENVNVNNVEDIDTNNFENFNTNNVEEVNTNNFDVNELQNVQSEV